MARGYYEMPQGKPHVVYGPPRPRLSPSTSPTNDGSLRSAFPAPAHHSPGTNMHSRRLRIVVLGLSPPWTIFGEDFDQRLSLVAATHCVNTISEGQVALSQKPDIVLVPTDPQERAVWSALSPDLVTYTSRGGRVATHLAQVQQLLQARLGMSAPDL